MAKPSMTTATTELFEKLKNTIQDFVGATMLSLHIEGQPVPASRPRVGRWGTYYSKSYSRWLKDSWKYVEKWDALPSDRPIIVMVDAVFNKAKSSKLDYPHQDIDNLEKGPLDQINKLPAATGKGIWEDDKQVVLLVGAKRWAEKDEEPGFYIYFTELKED